MHELDISYRGYLKEVEGYRELLEKEDAEVSTQRKIMCKLEQVMISLQEVGDEKVEIGQQITDLIDNKYRQLDQDFRNLGKIHTFDQEDYCKELENADPGQKESRIQEQLQTGASGGGSGNNGNNSGNGGSERPNKRPRRSRGDTGGEGGVVGDGGSGVSGQGRKQSGGGGGGGGGSGGGGGTGGKKKKRKSRGGGHQVVAQREETPPGGNNSIRVDELQHDVDEPTYCLCDQISYGEMILCDNDLCPIEWFHFVCVALTSKPKGKWFCPKCRGDRPNVMKPKSQFLKELERYNKEKEEKS
ncbi:hypothetical protein AAG570_009163 [Ranatra chinensis]|uniref:Inhibitor of growth protein n=1 Tax=Ranatra chinensis TaxID=642074 RepID=A0ABD0Z5T4_9HEMI